MKLKIQKINSEAVLPNFAKPGDAGLDFYSAENITLKPDQRQAIRTGIKMEIPDGYVGLIWDKSGLSINSGLKVIGGVIDSGYRGEIKIGLLNIGNEGFEIKAKMKIAQMLIQKVEYPEIIEEANSLSKTKRGEAGFGSTGII